jgi:hypothetical protein
VKSSPPSMLRWAMSPMARRSLIDYGAAHRSHGGQGLRLAVESPMAPAPSHDFRHHSVADRPGRPRRSRGVRPMIERKFAELTVHHRLAQARSRSLAKVTIQAVMTAVVVNCKRLVRLVRPQWCPT